MKKVKKWLILFIIGLVFLLLGVLGSLNPDISEWMVTHINRYYILGMGSLTSFLPFSLFEWLVIIAFVTIIIILIRLIILLIKRKFSSFFNTLITTLLAIFIVVGLYSFVTSPAYSRKESPIPQYEEKIDNDTLKTVITDYLNAFNATARLVKRDSNGNVDMSSYYTHQELAEKMIKEYERIYDGYLSSYTPKAKTILNSWFLSEMNITGITFSLSGEANVNKAMPAIDMPFTYAHEIAHTKGVMREDEANLYALYLCLISEDNFICYSGLFRAYSHLLSLAYYSFDKETYQEIVSMIDPLIINEISNYNKYWQEHNTLERIQKWQNDLYLKINGVKEGIDTYNDHETATDSGEKREDGTTIYDVVFSRSQKLLFYIYYCI